MGAKLIKIFFKNYLLRTSKRTYVSLLCAAVLSLTAIVNGETAVAVAHIHNSRANESVQHCPTTEDLAHLRNEGLNSTSVDIEVHHSFLDSKKGLVPGLEYKVVVKLLSGARIGSSYILASQPEGRFSGSGVAHVCNNLSVAVLENFVNSTLSLSFSVKGDQTERESVDISLLVSTPDDKKKLIHVVTETYYLRKECFSLLVKEYGRITEEDIPVRKDKCEEASLLIKSPDLSPLEATFEWLHIPASSNGWIRIRNISEDDDRFSLSYPLSNSSYENIVEVTAQNGFLLVTAIQCFECRIEATVMSVAMRLGCNTSITSYKGMVKEWDAQVVPGEEITCRSLLSAPPNYRVAVILNSPNISSENRKFCKDFAVTFYPVDNKHRTVNWQPCTAKSVQPFLSESGHLYVTWNSAASTFLSQSALSTQWILSYEFIPLCSDTTIEGRSYGMFCSRGFPHLFSHCKTTYSLYVPLGYSIEISFPVLEISSEKYSAFCDKTYIQVISRNQLLRNDDSVLTKLCRNVSSSTKQVPTFISPSNILDVHVVNNLKDKAALRFCATYKAHLLEDQSSSGCDFSWTSGEKYCYKAFSLSLDWTDALKYCLAKGGHLASLTDANISDLVEDVIKSSHLFKTSNAYWIGANDMTYENCYEWADGQVFDYSNWFPGWENYGGYGAQPSDDGLSHQNCVELRNIFKYPSKGEGVTERFYWNDRDCQVKNPFVCQKLKPGVDIEEEPDPSCNRSVTLSADHTYDVIISPNFPTNYPNNVECHYEIISASIQPIVVTFTDFVLEESESCEYDYLHMEEPDLIDNEEEPWRRCGDWDNKIKLLRYVTRTSRLRMTFVSDFSHSYSGFRAELRLDTARKSSSMLCDDEMFEMKAGSCYLTVTYPEASWSTAKQICSEAKAKLLTVESNKELFTVQDLIRLSRGFASGVVFWIGALSDASGSRWRWINGQALNSKQLKMLKMDAVKVKSERQCLALHWRQMRSSNFLQWIARKCDQSGGFICEKPAIVIPSNLNRTVSAGQGNLTSVNFPDNYVNNLDYTVKLQAPPATRILITFHHLDIEWQEECLYDYVALRKVLSEEGIKLCGDKERLGDRIQYESATNTAYLTFHSDYSITGTGYRISYEAVDLSACSLRSLVVDERLQITSPRYPNSYLRDLTCTTKLRASAAYQRLLLTVEDFDIEPDKYCFGDRLEVFLEAHDGLPAEKLIQFCENNILTGTKFLTYNNEAVIVFHTEASEWTENRRRGFNLTVEPISEPGSRFHSSVELKDTGVIQSINFPLNIPHGLNLTQRLSAPFGYRIFLSPPNVTSSSVRPSSCESSGLIVWDPYRDNVEQELWGQCKRLTHELLEEGISSFLNVLYLRSWSTDGVLLRYFARYDVYKDEHFVNSTIAVSAFRNTVEGCHPNPCQHGGRCVLEKAKAHCQCSGHYTGLFCHMTWCDMNVCGEFGECNLTRNSYVCECRPGYSGVACKQSATPCVPNPCENGGLCSVVNDTILCSCTTWYEGPRCERHAFRIPYKPLSQRMLEEPFWLGLITVFSVLVIILFVYCIKRKFADKIEKFLAEEIERSKFQPSPPATRYSLSSTQPSLTPGSQSPQTCPKSLFSRIRKNSILSSTCSPNATPEKRHPRTFSFDDILRRVHSSKRKPNAGSRGAGANEGSTGNGCGSSGYGNAKDEPAMKEEEKSRILASLVSSSQKSASRRMSLDEFFRMSERKLQLSAKKDATPEEADEESTNETSFISVTPPKKNRYSAPSFSEIQAIRELSAEYASSSDSVVEEPNTSEVQADVLPNPFLFVTDYQDKEETIEKRSSSENSVRQSPSPPRSPSQSSVLSSKRLTPPPAICITVDSSDRNSASDEETADNTGSTDSRVDSSKLSSPSVKRKCSYLEVPQPIPSIQVFSADQDHSTDQTVSLSVLKQEKSAQSSPCKADFVPPRKYSVDLPMPKILITANVTSCDSDEASPPRTPNPVKSMMYLSPLTVISSSADRTISESNLSTSGYSSISSPGLSRCNSSSPISDDVEQVQQHHHSSCNKKSEGESPKKTSQHDLQVTQMAYLTVTGNDKTFYFPPTVACHCQEVTSQPQVILNAKPTISQAGRKTPISKSRLLVKRNSYQTTSTDESIDDEGIGMDTIDVKIRKGELKSARDLEMFISGEKQDLSEQETSFSSSSMSNDTTQDTSEQLEPNKPDLLVCSLTKSGSVPNFKGSPRSGARKSDKIKKYADKHRKSPVLSPSSMSGKEMDDMPEASIQRNPSRTSVGAINMSSSESDDLEGFAGTRPKNQPRRIKKHDTPPSNGQKLPPQVSSSSEHEPLAERVSDATSVSESNGDSAPMDSRSHETSSSSESLPSTRDSTISGRNIARTENAPPAVKLGQVIASPLCSKHRLALEHASSYPPPRKVIYHHYHSQHNIRHCCRDASRGDRSAKDENTSPSVFLRQTSSMQPIAWHRRESCDEHWQAVICPSGSRVGCGALFARPILQSLNSVDSSLPSDSEEEASQSNSQGKERYFKPLLRISEQSSHPSLRRQEAIVEDEPSDDSSSETTVLLRRPPTDSSISDRSSPYLHQKDNSSSQSADISEWESGGTLQQSDSPRTPSDQKKIPENETTEK